MPHKGHPLLHMWLEPWVPPCVLLGWWFRPWELWLVDIVVLSMELQTSSTASVLSLAPPLGTPCSVQWLPASIRLYFSGSDRASQEKTISGSCQHILLGIHNSDCIWDESPGGAVSGWPFLQSLLHTFSQYFLSILFPLLKRIKEPTLWSSFFLSFMWSVNCFLGVPSFWVNIHISVSAYHVCSFVIGLPHSRWYFLVSSICLRISWSHCF